jgi:hypothetical protein
LVKHDPQLTGLATQKQGAAAARSVIESFPEIQLPLWIVLFPGEQKTGFLGNTSPFWQKPLASYWTL